MVVRAWFGDPQMPDLSLAAHVSLAIYFISLSLSFLVYKIKILMPASEIGNKRNEVQIFATTWVNLENMMLSDRSQS